ncbi:hypothetical protein FPOA_06581 [Fusarium poae]|uniref:Heterokaryon incompatibility domain-containing protein n=1 Tax=Fusarium poae TaxID=36050 RepID=A0A1B8B040_FUSPO|nr:hypothetical protein FPOA_06581 [Fusarium poae]
MKPQDLVCSKCWIDFFDTESFEKTCTAEDDPYIHHETIATWTLDEIKNASSSGCNWCSFIATFLDGSKHGNTPIKVVLLPGRERHRATPTGRNVFFVRIYYLCGEDEEFVDTCSIYAFTPSNDEASAHVTARPLRTDVGSQAASCQVQSWLEECKGHDGCSDPNTETVLPTRVIEVSPIDQLEPRIVETRGLRGRYATMSYCWGKTSFEALNQSNYGQFSKKLEVSILPPTFKEAIAIARSLSIPYLWIDALCIIQDSEDDKNREISLMKDIYASSCLTIVATSSQDVHGGFLQDRTHGKKYFTIPFRMKSNLFGSFSFGNLEDVAYDERSEPLAKRAWTLQEQLLAQRTVTYASHTMIWACKAGTKTFGNSFHYPYYDSWDTPTSLNLNKLLMDPQDAIELRHASFENDKLNAVAGIALHPSFTPVLGPEYLAGMWTYRLALQLTWYVEHHHRSLPNGERLESHRPKTYRAPSWSWASVEGGMIVFYDLFQPMYGVTLICRVVECSTTPRLSQNPFGEVISGHLKVKGWLRTAWIYPETSNLVLLPILDGEGGGKSTISQQECYEQFVEDFVAKNPDINLNERPEVLHGTWNNNTVGSCDESRFTEPMIVFCLGVACEGSEEHTCGLLLAKTADEGAYTRIGQFMRGRKKDFRNKHLPIEEVIIV